MRSVVIIDDKDHALQQVLHAFPPTQRAGFVFRHVAHLEQLREATLSPPFLVFLDFFLDNDQTYGTSVIPQLECEHLICFSSMQEMSEHMANVARETAMGRIAHVYAIQKHKAQLAHPQLAAMLRDILQR